MRRTVAAIDPGVWCGSSTTHTEASAAARPLRTNSRASSGPTVPWAIRWSGTDARPASTRSAISPAAISSENTRAGVPAAAAARVNPPTRAVFPTDGRAARMTSVPGRNPPITRSRDGNPVGTIRASGSPFARASIRPRAAARAASSRTGSARWPRSPIARMARSASACWSGAGWTSS